VPGVQNLAEGGEGAHHTTQPVHLQLPAEKVCHSLVAWHLRDTSKLQGVQILQQPYQSYVFYSKVYRKAIQQLLTHLTSKVSLLGSLDYLDLAPLRRQEAALHCATAACGTQWAGGVGCEGMVLHRRCIAAFTHFTTMQNLKVGT